MAWNDPRSTQAPSGPRESLFLNLKDELRVRVVGEPEFFERHWTRGRVGKDVTVRCPGATICPICAMGDKPRVRALFPVLDRKTGKMKLMDVPQIVVGQIRALKEGEWGDPVNYDLSIKQTTVGKKTDYQVIPNLPTALSAIDQQEIRKFFETVDYKKYARPHSNEEAMAILNGTPLPSKQASAPAPAALPPGVMMPPAPQSPGNYVPQQVPTGTQYVPPAASYPAQSYVPPAPQAPAVQVPGATASYPAPGVTVQSGGQASQYVPPAPQVQMAPQTPAPNAVNDNMFQQFMPPAPKV